MRASLSTHSGATASGAPWTAPLDPFPPTAVQVAAIMVDADVLFPCASTQAVFTALPFRDNWIQQFVSDPSLAGSPRA